MFFTMDEVALLTALLRPTSFRILYQKMCGSDIMKRINTSKITEQVMRI